MFLLLSEGIKKYYWQKNVKVVVWQQLWRENDMTFKEKHLLPLALAATLTASCSDENGFFKKNEVSLGLLDERPLKEKDKYNT